MTQANRLQKQANRQQAKRLVGETTVNRRKLVVCDNVVPCKSAFTLPDLAFGFVHKRFGNEITDYIENLTIKTEMLMNEKLPDQV